MYTEYDIENGKKILLFTSDLFSQLKKETIVEGYEVENKKIIKKIKTFIYNDNGGYYIIYKAKKIYINNYLYLTLEDLIKKMETEEISIDEFVTTMIKEGNKAIIIEKLPILEEEDKCKNEQMPQMQDVGCRIISLEPMLHHRVVTEPLDEENQKKYGMQEYNISDLYCLVKNGYFKLENKCTLCKQKTLKK